MTHDAGIVSWPGGSLTIAVLAHEVHPPWQAMDAIAEIAALVTALCADSLELPGRKAQPERR